MADYEAGEREAKDGGRVRYRAVWTCFFGAINLTIKQLFLVKY